MSWAVYCHGGWLQDANGDGLFQYSRWGREIPFKRYRLRCLFFRIFQPRKSGGDSEARRLANYLQLISMRTVLLLLFTWWISFTNAQNKTPSDIYWEKETARYNQAYLDAIRKNYNTPVSRGGGVDQKAVEQLAAQIKARKAGGTPSTPVEEPADDGEDDNEYNNEMRQSYLNYRAALKSERSKFVAHNIEYFKKTPPYNLLSFSDMRYILNDEFFLKEFGRRTFLPHSGAAAAFSRFRQIADSATCDSLLYYVEKIKWLPGAAQECISFLQMRFPERKEELEKVEFRNMAYYWGAGRPDYHFGMEANTAAYPPSIMEDPATSTKEKRRIYWRFMSLLEKYPDVVPDVVGWCRPLEWHPLRMAISACADAACQEKYYWQLLMAKYPSEKEIWDRRSGYTGEPSEMQGWMWARTAYQLKDVGDFLSTHARERLMAFTADDWQQIADRHQVSILQVVLAFGRLDKKGKPSTDFKTLKKMLP